MATTQLTIDQALQIALQHHQAGQLLQAENLYRQILAQQPRHADALHYLGVIAGQTGRNDISVDLIRQSLAIQPNNAEAHNNLGNALRNMHRIDESIEACRQAIALKPNFPDAYNNLGNALKDKVQPDEAIAAFRQAITLNSSYAEAYNNLGAALADKGQPEEAVRACRQAIAINPNYPEAHYNLGTILRGEGHLAEAIDAYRRAIAIRPNYPQAYNNLGVALGDNQQLDQAIAAYRQAIALNPNYAKAHSCLIRAVHYHPDYDAQTIADEHRKWSRQHAQSLRQVIRIEAYDRDLDRRLRIGYISPDLRQHSVAYFLESLLTQHDCTSVEVFCYADVLRPDATTARFQQLPVQWRNLLGLSDEDVANRIRQDHIDILADLAGHTTRNRLFVFARKPAPIQVTYLGYPNTTGLDAIDYRLTDEYADPPGITDALHSEKLMRLPQTFLCYRPSDTAPPVGIVPASETGRITFGSFNTLLKVTTPMLELWARILHLTPGSRLLIKAKALRSQTASGPLRKMMEATGITPDRLILHPWRESHEQHLGSYQQVDIALDTFPYHGTTTTCEALWMGVPVVTLAGTTHVSRVGVSLLSNVGLPEMIANSKEEYVRLATKLANDLPRLKNLRSTLRQRMAHSCLMDAPRFARHVEAAYRQMWRTWCTTSDSHS